jgi:hypothetical protein
MRFSFLMVLLIITTNTVKSQVSNLDSIYGKIKRIREKTFDITDINDPKQLEIDEFSSEILVPKTLNLTIYDYLFSGNYIEYQNFERFFNENGKMIKQTWFVKKDEFYKSTTYTYDENNRVTSKIDSTSSYVTIKKHYYEDFDEYTIENIISLGFDIEYFNHTIKQYKDKKIIRIKHIDEFGNTTEYINNYNKNGKLKTTFIKNPETWRKNEEGGWSYGVHDSIPNVYKNRINEYDEKNRILKSLEYGYSIKNNYKEPILLHQVLYNYEKNKNTVRTIYESGMISTKSYIYDKYDKIIKYYCCSDNFLDSNLIREFKYKKGKIVSCIFITKFIDKNEIQKIDYKYKYDDKNNWIEIIKIVNGKERFKRTREIEYF